MVVVANINFKQKKVYKSWSFDQNDALILMQQKKMYPTADDNYGGRIFSASRLSWMHMLQKDVFYREKAK
jgi:hypothetical protein